MCPIWSRWHLQKMILPNMKHPFRNSPRANVSSVNSADFGETVRVSKSDGVADQRVAFRHNEIPVQSARHGHGSASGRVLGRKQVEGGGQVGQPRPWPVCRLRLRGSHIRPTALTAIYRNRPCSLLLGGGDETPSRPSDRRSPPRGSRSGDCRDGKAGPTAI